MSNFLIQGSFQILKLVLTSVRLFELNVRLSHSSYSQTILP